MTTDTRQTSNATPDEFDVAPDELSASIKFLRDEILALKKITRTERMLTAARKRNAQLKRDVDFHSSRADMALRLNPHGMPAAIPPDILQSLIRLCHPDRHSNSDAANAATAWLLSQR